MQDTHEELSTERLAKSEVGERLLKGKKESGNPASSASRRRSVTMGETALPFSTSAKTHGNI